MTIQATLKRSGDIGKLESNEEILEITSVYAHLPELHAVVRGPAATTKKLSVSGSFQVPQSYGSAPFFDARIRPGIGNSVEHGNLRNDVNLSMDSDTRFRASKLCPSEYGHAEVNGRRVDSIELAMQFELFCNASGLGNRHHVESELLKDAMISETVGLRQHLSVDGLVAKSEVFRLLGMGGCYICEFPKASTAHKLTEHQNQQMVPMRHRPALGPVAVLGEYTPELPLREELYYLCKNECPNMHICSDFESDTKVSISKPGQGIAGLKRYA